MAEDSIVAEDKARNRVESSDSARERNAVFRPQGPAVARMDFFNGLLGWQGRFPLSFRRARTANAVARRAHARSRARACYVK